VDLYVDTNVSEEHTVSIFWTDVSVVKFLSGIEDSLAAITVRFFTSSRYIYFDVSK
jgi:hypothetical protein